MKKSPKSPQSLQEAIIYFADAQNCHDFMTRLRWPDGKVICPRCGSDEVSYLPNAKVFKCYQKHEKAKFSLKVGTVMEDSPIGLDKWLPVFWLIVNCKNGVSSWEIHRAIKVTQKTAWFMLQRARLAMQDNNTGGKLGGEVEVDETYIGGKVRNMHKERKNRAQKDSQLGDKAIVLGILERATEKKSKRVRAAVIKDRKAKSMRPVIRQNVEPGTAIHSDEFAHNWKMEDEYTHNIVNHLETYVEGNVHTNGIENFWSLLKRGLSGTYVAVEPFHLFRYVDEQAFRFNNREDMNDGDRFEAVMKQILGKRLTYQELIGKAYEPSEETPF